MKCPIHRDAEVGWLHSVGGGDSFCDLEMQCPKGCILQVRVGWEDLLPEARVLPTPRWEDDRASTLVTDADGNTYEVGPC